MAKLILHENVSLFYFKFRFESNHFTVAFDYCNIALNINPEEKHQLELFELRGRIYFSPGNYAAAKNDVGNVYDIVVEGMAKLDKKSKWINDTYITHLSYVAGFEKKQIAYFSLELVKAVDRKGKNKPHDDLLFHYWAKFPSENSHFENDYLFIWQDHNRL